MVLPALVLPHPLMSSTSDSFVSPRKWTLALLALAVTVIGGAALAIALLLGAANPPHAANLVFNANNADALKLYTDGSHRQIFSLATDLVTPFSVEIEARNSGEAKSAWGIGISNYWRDQKTSLMVDNSGYGVTGQDADMFSHFEFPHIHRGGFNHMSAVFDSNGVVTFRINDEVFRSWTLSAKPIYELWLITYGDPKLEWKSIKIYTG